MEIRAFFAAEQIVKRMNGTQDVLGFGIRNVNIRVAEGRDARAQLAVMCHLEFTPAETGKKEVKMSLISPDGELRTSLDFELDVAPQRGTALVNLQGPFPMTFNESGDHAIVLTVNGHEVARWPLHVNLVRPAQS